MAQAAHATNASEKHPWPRDTAGFRMTVKVPTASPEQTIGEVQEILRKNIADFKTINYIYVLDAEGKLVGILSIRDLYRFPPGAAVGDVCKRSPLVEMRASSHQERAAYLALKHNIKAVPVVDHNHQFLGAIPADTILSILQKEMHEDMLRLAGIRHPKALATDVLELPVYESFVHRFPWLFFGLLGGIAASRVIGFFEQTLQRNLILAAFIPLIVYMSDAVGTQMEAYIIRDLARETSLPFRRYFLRQMLIVSLIAVSFGMLLLLASFLLQRNMLIGATLGLSLTAAILSSVCTGLLVPYAFSRMKLDPADASGPIATIVQDILSVVIYFGIASWLLSG